MDPPFGGTGLGESRTLRRGPETGEAQAVAGRGAIAAEVGDRVAVRLAGGEHESVVAAVAGHKVVAAFAIEHVIAGIADELSLRRCRRRTLRGRVQPFNRTR